MVELHRDAAIAVAADGRLLAANARAIVEMGAAGGTGSLFDLAAEEPDEVRDILKRVFAGPAPVPVGLALRREGRIEERTLSGAPIGVHAGREVALLVMSSAPADAPRDQEALREVAAELSRLNLQLVEEKQRAEEASHGKTEFMARVSHELRTPLNAIIGFSELMMSGVFGPITPDRYAAYVRDILVSGRRLLELVDDVLDLSKVEAGTMTLREQAVDLAQLGEQVVRLIGQAAAEKELTLEAVAAPGLPQINADPRAVRQMLLNLLSNAVKFTLPRGRIRLVMAAENGSATIAVEDTGIGIAEAHIAGCFRPFDQVDDVLTRRFAGSGLGLAITKALVELHGGEIHLRSTVGVGTSVKLTFPAERSRAPSDAG